MNFNRCLLLLLPSFILQIYLISLNAFNKRFLIIKSKRETYISFSEYILIRFVVIGMNDAFISFPYVFHIKVQANFDANIKIA